MEANSNELYNLLNEHDVARLTQLSLASISRRRTLRLPPNFMKLGASVRYKPSEITAWLNWLPSGGSDV